VLSVRAWVGAAIVLGGVLLIHRPALAAAPSGD
jgi:drug/metabolite transporter (DMT)-like permease